MLGSVTGPGDTVEDSKTEGGPPRPQHTTVCLSYGRGNAPTVHRAPSTPGSQLPVQAMGIACPPLQASPGRVVAARPGAEHNMHPWEPPSALQNACQEAGEKKACGARPWWSQGGHVFKRGRWAE